jgi:ketosteroid isomerase-like protein
LSGLDWEGTLSVEDRRTVLVRAVLDAIGRQDPNALEALLLDEARWWFPPSIGSRGVPRPVAGKASIVRIVIPERPAFQSGSTTWHFLHLVKEDDLVAAHVEREATTSDGHPYRVEYNFLFRLAAEKVAEVWDIMDTADATAQVYGHGQ